MSMWIKHKPFLYEWIYALDTANILVSNDSFNLFDKESIEEQI